MSQAPRFPRFLAGFLLTSTAFAGTVFSTFGPGQSFDTSYYEMVGGLEWAAQFQPSQNATLDSIDLALAVASGTDSLNVELTADSGADSPGIPIETFALSGIPSSATVESASSTLHPFLAAGSNYWLVVQQGGADTDGDWFLSGQGFSGMIKPSMDGINWGPSAKGFAGGNMPAFDVNGTAVAPESSTAMLLTIGLAGAWFAIKARRRSA